MWQLALELGASVGATADERVTHVVAGAPGMAKQAWAAGRPGVRVVTPAWLHWAGATWRRPDEAAYAVEPPPPPPQPQPQSPPPDFLQEPPSPAPSA